MPWKVSNTYVSSILESLKRPHSRTITNSVGHPQSWNLWKDLIAGLTNSSGHPTRQRDIPDLFERQEAIFQVWTSYCYKQPGKIVFIFFHVFWGQKVPPFWTKNQNSFVVGANKNKEDGKLNIMKVVCLYWFFGNGFRFLGKKEQLRCVMVREKKIKSLRVVCVFAQCTYLFYVCCRLSI